MTAKILHVSDTHLGKNQYGSKVRSSDYAEAFDTTVDIALSEDVDAVIHTGDMFDSRTPDTGAVSRAFKTIGRLEEEEIPFLGIVGNHERKWENQWMDVLETLNNVHRLDQKPYKINGEVAVYGFDSIRDSRWESMEFELEECEDDMIVCLCMHELFDEIVPPAKADRSLSYVIEKLNMKPDIIPLGDYHAAVDQEVSDVPAFYAGATERTSATTRDPTVRIIKTEDGNVKSYNWRKVEGVRDQVPRPFYKVGVELTDSSTRSHIRRRVNENVPEDEMEEAVVVVNITGSSDAPITANEAYEVLQNLSVKVPYVSDKRTSEVFEFDSEDVSDPTSIDIDDMIDEEIDEEVSDSTKKVDKEIVRDLTVNKSDIRDIISERFDLSNDGDKE